MPSNKSPMYDVVVIGAGNAAMAAAMSAHEEGASVVILEKAPKEWRGGNTRFSGGLFRVAFDDIKQIDQVVA
ncbi:MAG: FAD-dependent oxidoreductase, partial [Rhodospirillales bacterium]